MYEKARACHGLFVEQTITTRLFGIAPQANVRKLCPGNQLIWKNND